MCRIKGLTVHCKTLEECDFRDGEFRAVTAFALLEHLNDPSGFLKTTKRIIAPGGVFAAVVPNSGSLAAMMLREKLSSFDGRNHLQYFNRSSLCRLFESCGYRVLKADTVLTALPNLRKYMQFLDPYGPEEKKVFLPEGSAALFKRDKFLEKLILKHGLGLKLRVFATPSKR
jgi:2-polyprenyl-3-methyl-5-hydroxy-6-metoxy-1,4-benzoquinol methylase